MGDWIPDEIMRTFGIDYESKPDCCFVMVKLTKTHKSEQLGNLRGVALKDYVVRAIDKLNVSDTAEVRRFMRSYGTHYIDSYKTGNFIYQVGRLLFLYVNTYHFTQKKIFVFSLD